jgi:hypothetical protein
MNPDLIEIIQLLYHTIQHRANSVLEGTLDEHNDFPMNNGASSAYIEERRFLPFRRIRSTESIPHLTACCQNPQIS